MSDDYTTVLYPCTLQDQAASFDFVNFDLDPTPDINDGELDSHGTQCSGIIGMTNNSFCGIGVAYQANIGGRLTCASIYLSW